MIDPITITTTETAIAAVIFNKAIEKGGENLGEAVSNKIGQIISAVRNKFKGVGMERVLTQAQNNPTKPNQKFFQQALEMQMTSDSEFANKLKIMIDEIKSDEKANTIFFKDMNIQGSAKLGKIDLKSKRGNMEAVTNSEIGGDFIVGDVNMTNNS